MHAETAMTSYPVSLYLPSFLPLSFSFVFSGLSFSASNLLRYKVLSHAIAVMPLIHMF